jgi:hypothetical protein
MANPANGSGTNGNGTDSGRGAGGRFLPGNRMKGAGRKKGSRSKLSEAFLQDLHKAWLRHGAQAPSSQSNSKISELPIDDTVNLSVPRREQSSMLPMPRCWSRVTMMTDPNDADLALMGDMPTDEMLAFVAKQEGIEQAKVLIEEWHPGYWEEAADVAVALERHDLDDLAAIVWRHAEPLPSELTRTNPWIPPCEPGCVPHARQAAIWCNRWVLRR